jgi:UPF0176 protein
MTLTVASFYKFVAIDDGPVLRAHLRDACGGLDLTGTILLAPEGLNGTIAGGAGAIDAILALLRADPRFGDLEVKRSAARAPPFGRLKIKLKREIVTFGRPEANPAVRTGQYVDARDWNALISDPDVVVIDTRNSYEVGIGTFLGARDPGTASFSQFPAYAEANLDPARHPRIAMFCTGGIRCEKASAYLLDQGFGEVYHLRGGILKYLEDVPAEDSLWSGACYVFDGRVALQHGVSEGTHRMCLACGAPVGQEAPSCPACGAP